MMPKQLAPQKSAMQPKTTMTVQKEVRAHASLPFEGEVTDTIHIDVSLIPDYVRDNLAAATLELIREIFQLETDR